MKYIFLFAFLGTLSSVSGQPVSDSSFRDGFQFTVQHEENSNAFIRFDESVLDLNYKVLVDKGYSLLSSKSGIHNFSAITQRIVDTVVSEGRQTIYNSDNLQIQSSRTDRLLDSLLKNPDTFSINYDGNIDAADMSLDPISELMGLYAGSQSNGDLFVILPGLIIDSSLEVGKTWVVETVYAKAAKHNTTYKIITHTKYYVTVEYERTITSEDLNANENGVLMIDASTGFVEEKNSKTVSNAKMLFNGKPCLVERWSDKVQRFTYFND